MFKETIVEDAIELPQSIKGKNLGTGLERTDEKQAIN